MAINADAPIVIDPRLDVPPGLADVVSIGDARDPNQTPVEFDDVEIPDDSPTPVADNSFVPTPPTSFSIYSQTVRTAPDGTSLVDVVLDIPDQFGVVNYDVRVAKI